MKLLSLLIAATFVVAQEDFTSDFTADLGRGCRLNIYDSHCNNMGGHSERRRCRREARARAVWEWKCCRRNDRRHDNFPDNRNRWPRDWPYGEDRGEWPNPGEPEYPPWDPRCQHGGVYPACTPPFPQTCPNGGQWPVCQSQCPHGGVFPNCLPQQCPFGGTFPNCPCPNGQGQWPHNCNTPLPNQQCPNGQGQWPHCTSGQHCANGGQWPQCLPPTGIPQCPFGGQWPQCQCQNNQGQFPHCQIQVCPNGGQWPTCQGLPGQGQCPNGQGQWPNCQGQCPNGQGQWPNCQSQCPFGGIYPQCQCPPGGGQFPNCNNQVCPNGGQWPQCLGNIRPTNTLAQIFPSALPTISSQDPITPAYFLLAMIF